MLQEMIRKFCNDAARFGLDAVKLGTETVKMNHAIHSFQEPQEFYAVQGWNLNL